MTEMRKKGMALLLSAWMLLTAGCSQGTPAGTSSVPPESSQVASGSEMAGVTDVVEEGMVTRLRGQPEGRDLSDHCGLQLLHVPGGPL